ncbi:MAG TPA: radical SAM protein [Paludibacteraceae bacterium]|nr:radical SAM protein [Paludibacteraceae bacterium]
MKHLYTNTKIETELLGKVTFKRKPIFSKNDYVSVSEFPELAELNEGDVVLITPDGNINVLYEIKSMHNAIMATERCNHRCIMCPQPPILQETDKTNFNIKLLSLFDKNTHDIGITGGEPTLIGDNLFVLIEYIKKHLPKSSISLLSNGVKFSEKEYAEKLALTNHHDLQIDIPLFSDIDTEHN